MNMWNNRPEEATNDKKLISQNSTEWKMWKDTPSPIGVHPLRSTSVPKTSSNNFFDHPQVVVISHRLRIYHKVTPQSGIIF